MIPTVGFNMRKVTKGNVTIKVWECTFFFWASISVKTSPFCALALFVLEVTTHSFIATHTNTRHKIAVGYRRTAEVSQHVGALLPRCECYCVSFSCFVWKSCGNYVIFFSHFFFKTKQTNIKKIQQKVTWSMLLMCPRWMRLSRSCTHF